MRQRERERGSENKWEGSTKRNVCDTNPCTRTSSLSITSVSIPAEREDEVFSFPTHEKVSFQLQIWSLGSSLGDSVLTSISRIARHSQRQRISLQSLLANTLFVINSFPWGEAYVGRQCFASLDNMHQINCFILDLGSYVRMFFLEEMRDNWSGR